MRKLTIVRTEDEAVRAEVTSGLKARKGYCPCAIEATPDTKCMCKEFRDQTTEGPCHCGLYEKRYVETDAE